MNGDYFQTMKRKNELTALSSTYPKTAAHFATIFFYSILILASCVGVYLSLKPDRIEIINGRLNHNDQVIWGLGQYSALYKSGRRPNITRNAPGEFRPNRTEVLWRLTENMTKYGYPALEHQFGLWYDRRRDIHDTECREDSNVVPPFMEQPWVRSKEGRACDGLPLYNLAKFNDWYFGRLEQFAHLSDKRGIVFYHNYYMQHALLERQTHYVDHPFRPGNSLHLTAMPETVPAANNFYGLQFPGRNDLHRRYIRRVLDAIGDYKSVLHFTSGEYTGDAEFVKFWMDIIVDWENEKSDRDVKIGLSAPKDVIDEILSDPKRASHIDAIDLRYFWYRKHTGSLHAIEGGKSFPGRYFLGTELESGSSPEMIFRQTYEYRQKHPDKILFHAVGLKLENFLSFFIAGGSINITRILYGGHRGNYLDPEDYMLPESIKHFQPTFHFIQSNLKNNLRNMTTNVDIVEVNNSVFALASNKAILCYSVNSDSFTVDLRDFGSRYLMKWFNPETGETIEKNDIKNKYTTVQFTPPDRPSLTSKSGWLLLLKHSELR
jgi:hypothetical protein